jgi:hypothetical protein
LSCEIGIEDKALFFQGLNQLIKTNGISVVCHEKKYNWEHTNAHASSSPSET